MRRIAWVLILALLLGAGLALAAGTPSLDRWAIGGGGGTVEGGGLQLSFTLGQPVAGTVSSGGTELCAGFWCAGAGTSLYLPVILRP